MTDFENFESKISQLDVRFAEIGKLLDDLKGRRSELAPSAVDGDKQARSELAQIDEAASHAEKESGLISAALGQLKRLAAQAKDAAAAKEQQKREQAAKVQADIILNCDNQIDALFSQLKDLLDQRKVAATALGKLRIADNHLVMRLHQRFGPTHALAFHGLSPFIGHELVEPHHKRALSDSDAWLRKLAGEQTNKGKSNGKENQRRNDHE
jgi:DNA repair exonuclease SbcCD ATPase subunit